MIKLNKEQQELAESAIPFARSMIKSAKKDFPFLRDEFDSEAMFAVVKASSKYDPNNTTAHFTTFIRKGIIGAISDVKKESIRFSNAHTNIDLFDTVPVVSNFLVDHKAGRPSDGLEQEEQMDWWFRKLPKNYRPVFEKIYLEGLNFVETSKQLKMKPAMVKKIHTKGIELIREAYGSNIL